MKKWLICLCALLLFLTGAALAEDECAHDGGMQSLGAEEHACLLCGERFAHEVEQRQVAPTCCSVGYTMDVCPACGWEGAQYDFIAPSGKYHLWEDWTTASEATCTQPGQRRRFCSLCGEMQTEEIPVTAHRVTYLIVDPDCLQDGYTVEVCADCGWEGAKTNIVPRGAQYHAWGPFEETLAPGCETNGEQMRICEICGAVHRQEIPALGHAPVETVVPPTQEADGYTVETCSRCGAELSDRSDFQPALLFSEEYSAREADGAPASGVNSAGLLVAPEGAAVLVLQADPGARVSVHADSEWFARNGVDFVAVETRGLSVRFAPQQALVCISEDDGAFSVTTSLYTDGFSEDEGDYVDGAFCATGDSGGPVVLCARFLCVTLPAGARSVMITREP